MQEYFTTYLYNYKSIQLHNMLVLQSKLTNLMLLSFLIRKRLNYFCSKNIKDIGNIIYYYFINRRLYKNNNTVPIVINL